MPKTGGESKQSAFMKRCVSDLTSQGKDKESAFAICKSTGNKAGYFKSGSMELTAKGKKRSAELEKEPDMAEKEAKYRALLKNKAHESTTDLLSRIERLPEIIEDMMIYGVNIVEAVAGVSVADAIDDMIDQYSDDGVISMAQIGRDLLDIGKNNPDSVRKAVAAMKKAGIRVVRR